MIMNRNTTAEQLNRGVLTTADMLWIDLFSHRSLIPLKICGPTSSKQFLEQNRKTSRKDAGSSIECSN